MKILQVLLPLKNDIRNNTNACDCSLILSVSILDCSSVLDVLVSADWIISFCLYCWVLWDDCCDIRLYLSELIDCDVYSVFADYCGLAARVVGATLLHATLLHSNPPTFSLKLLWCSRVSQVSPSCTSGPASRLF